MHSSLTVLLRTIIFLNVILVTDAQTAQGQGSLRYRLKAWATFTKASWRDSVYRFNNFKEGHISFVGSTSPSLKKVKVNYNIWFDRMALIGEDQDTIFLEDRHTIKLITIENTIFYNDDHKGYLEIRYNAPVALGLKLSFDVIMESSNGERFVATDLRNATSRYDRIYTLTQHYYFIDKKGRLFRATPLALRKSFPEHKKSIRKYLRENDIHFNEERHLIKALAYCNDLVPQTK
jgi:hypothetical protein